MTRTEKIPSVVPNLYKLATKSSEDLSILGGSARRDEDLAGLVSRDARIYRVSIYDPTSANLTILPSVPVILCSY